MHSLHTPQGKVRPSQHPLRVVFDVTERMGIGPRVDRIMVLQERREITKAEDKNLSRIILLRVFSKTLVGVAHLILVLLRAVMEQVLASEETIILVSNLDINILSVLSSHQKDLVRL